MSEQTALDNEQVLDSPVWAIVELFGHKVLAGQVCKSEMMGGPMLRVDVPATPSDKAFTRLLGVNAVYSVTFVSEDVARAAAGRCAEKAVTVYVPEIDVIAHKQKIRELEYEVEQLRERQLPPPGGKFDMDKYDPLDVDQNGASEPDQDDVPW